MRQDEKNFLQISVWESSMYKILFDFGSGKLGSFWYQKKSKKCWWIFRPVYEYSEPEGEISTDVIEDLSPRSRRKLYEQKIRREEELDVCNFPHFVDFLSLPREKSLRYHRVKYTWRWLCHYNMLRSGSNVVWSTSWNLIPEFCRLSLGMHVIQFDLRIVRWSQSQIIVFPQKSRTH